MRAILLKKFLSIFLSITLLFFQGLVYPTLSLFKVSSAYAVTPVITVTSPTTNQYFNSAATVVVINPDQVLTSGTITITRTSGTADGGSPHTCTLAGTALNSGSHTVDLTDNTNTNHCSAAQTLVNGTVYDFVFSGTNAVPETGTTTVTGVTFDTSAPTLSTSKVTGANQITLTFNESVNAVAGNFTNVTVAAVARNVSSISGSGSNTILVNFDGAATSTSATGTMDISNAVTDLASNAYAGSAGQALTDGQVPTVTTVSSAHADGSFKSGEVIDIEVTYTENITVNIGGGTPTLALNSSGSASYNNGSGATTMVFRYTVGGGQTSSDLDYSATNSLVLNGGTMQDAAGNNSNNTLPTPGAVNSLGANKAIIIDTTAPTAAVTYSPNRAVKSGESLTITATFTESITGTPQIAISGSNTVAATNMTMSSATVFTYTHTVAAGNGAATVALSVGTDAAGNVVTSAPTSGTTFTVDNTTPTFTAARTGLNTIVLTFNENVSASDTSTTAWTLSAGSVTAATQPSSSTTLTLTTSGLTGTTETPTVTYVAANGTVVDTATNEVANGANATATDGVSPTATVTYSPNRAVKSGESLIITATFTEAITNTPRIAISGSNTVAATNLSMTSSTVFTYTHTVGAGNGAATVALSIGTDTAGNVVTAAPTSGATFTVDNTAPNAPVISTVATDNKINAAEKTAIVVVGTAEADSLVTMTLTDSASTVKTGTQQLSGGGTAYSITINGSTATALIDGNIAVSVTATDAAGNVSLAGTSTVPLDTVAPSAPVITSPIMTDNRVNNSEKTAIVIAGTAEANSLVTVTLTDSASTVKTGTQQLSGGGTAYSITIDGTTATALLDGSITVSVTSTDAAGNVSSAGTATITQDTVTPTLSSVAPAANAFIKNVTTSSQISYTLSEAVASGSVTITRTSGTADGFSPHTCDLAGTALNSGAHTLNLSDTTNGCSVAQTLVSGAVYSFVFDATDASANTASTVTRTGVTFDNTLPTFTGLLANNAFINNVTSATDVIYTLSETISFGQLVFTRTGGTAGSNFTCTLVGTALASGAHSLNVSDTTNGCTTDPTLSGNPVDGAIYSLTFDGNDAANNAAATTTVTGVTYDVTAPVGSFTINSGVAYTNSVNVSLNFSGVSSDVVTLELRNGTVGAFQTPVSYTNPYSYTFPTSDGTKTVSVRFTDSAGNQSSGVISDDIILDTAAPVTSSVSINNVTAGSTNSPFVKNGDSVNLTATVTDTNQSAITASMISANFSSLGVGATATSATSYNSGTGVATWANLTVAGTAEAIISVAVNAVDAASNAASSVSDSIDANNSTPVAVSDSLTATKNTALNFTTTTLLSNDTDAGLDSLTFVGVGTSASHGTISISGTAGIYTPANNYVGPDSFTYTVNDGFLTSTPGTINLTVDPPVSSGQAVLSSTNTVSTTSPQLVVGGSTTLATVTVPSTVTNASLNVTNVLSSSGGTSTATLSGPITVNAATALGTVTMQMPSGTVITGATSNWTGVINVPQVQLNSTVTLSGGNGTDTNTTGVIEVGFGDVPLTLSKAVRLLIPSQAGRLAAYSRAGVITAITNVCSADTQTAADALAAGGDCKIDVGADLVIWTKHFTKFVAYTQSTFSQPGPVSCNDAKPSATPILRSAVAGTNSVTLNWTDTASNASYYVVTYGDAPGKQQYGNNNIGGYGTTSFTVSGLSGGTTYYFRVRNGAGCATGEYSSELSATPGGGVVSGPAAGFAAGVLGAKVQISDISSQTSDMDTEGDIQGAESDQSIFENIMPTPAGGGIFSAIGSFLAGLLGLIGKLFGR